MLLPLWLKKFVGLAPPKVEAIIWPERLTIDEACSMESCKQCGVNLTCMHNGEGPYSRIVARYSQDRDRTEDFQCPACGTVYPRNFD